MEISRRMNLVMSIDTENGQVYVHSTPISKAVYREHFLPLSKTFAAIFGQGLNVIAGPRVAYLMLERVSKQDGIWDGPSGLYNTLVQEVIRNSTAIVPVEGKGWEELPLDVAMGRGMLEPDDVLGEIVFFTCVYAINKPAQAASLMADVSSLWESVSTSLTSTEWATSLPILTGKEISGETVNTSSVPS